MRITIIGGGSYQWTPELLADLFGTPALAGATIVLEDIDPAPLAKMKVVAEKVNEALGAGATIETTTDQKRALDGADYVIVTISTGGFASMAVDLDVPARFGIRQSVGDSVGPGGVNRALRNIPVLVGIGRDMDEVCPDAWMLNITNPMTTLTRSVDRACSVKVVGLCHEVGNWCLDLAIALQTQVEKIAPKVTGVNHFPVVTSLDVDGQDGFEVIRSLIEKVGGLDAHTPGPGHHPTPGEKFSPEDFVQRHLLCLRMFERWGAVPAAGDRHLAEFVPWVLTEESDWGAHYGIELTTIERREAHQLGYIADVDEWVAGTKDLQTWQSGELPGPVIDSLVTGHARALPVNIANAGQCPDLPAGVIVESMCVIDTKGIRGRDTEAVPAPFAEILRRQVAVQEMTVEAALTGDRELARAAFALDPLAGRGDLVRTDQMVDELFAGSAEWLSQFASA